MKTIKVLIPVLVLAGTATLIYKGSNRLSMQADSSAKVETTVNAAPKTRLTTLKDSSRLITPATRTLESSVSPNVSSPDKSRLIATHPLGNRIRSAIKNGDLETTVIEQLRAELRRNVPETGRAILDAMRMESDPTVLIILANLLGENPDVMISSEAIKTLAELAESDLPARRQSALAALSFVETITPDLLNRITMLSREDASSDVRVSAIAAMSVWMGRKPQLVERLSQELLATAHSTDDSVVRGNAIQLISNQGQKLDDNVLQELQQFLRTETVPQNRQLAAYGLGGATGTARPAALLELQQAYLRETDMDTRRVILMQLVRAGQEEAPSILRSLPTDHSLLQNDVKDYLEILAQGLRNSDDIWTHKSLRDAHRGTEIGMTTASNGPLN